MKSFLKGLSGVFLTLFLATAWMWVFVLKDMRIIDAVQRFWLIAAFTAVLAIHIGYLHLPEPLDRGIIEAQRPVIESYLRAFLRRYYDQLSSLATNHEEPPPCVRVNVMLPTKLLRGIRGSYLRIYHVACPPQIVYNDDELSETWKAKEGTCGWVWSEGDRSIYDSKDPKLSLPSDRLTESQRYVTSHLNSTLSMPVWDKQKNKVVAVLNLDSEQNIEESFFNSRVVIDLAAACAQHLVAHCPPNGVAA